VDLENALHHGQGPQFYREKFPRQLIESLVELHSLGDNIVSTMKELPEMNEVLQTVFWDLTGTSAVLTRGLIKLEPFVFQDILISVLYRVIYQYPISKCDLTSGTDGLLSLSILAFISTVFFQAGLLNRLPYDLLAQNLRQLLASVQATSALSNRLLLWIFHVGGISVLTDHDMVWLLPKIQSTASLLGVTDWQSAKSMISAFPWLSVFHDKPAHMLWDRIKLLDSLADDSTNQLSSSSR
jgi:hypothetical protein